MNQIKVEIAIQYQVRIENLAQAVKTCQYLVKTVNLVLAVIVRQRQDGIKNLKLATTAYWALVEFTQLVKVVTPIITTAQSLKVVNIIQYLVKTVNLVLVAIMHQAWDGIKNQKLATTAYLALAEFKQLVEVAIPTIIIDQ